MCQPVVSKPAPPLCLIRRPCCGSPNFPSLLHFVCAPRTRRGLERDGFFSLILYPPIPVTKNELPSLLLNYISHLTLIKSCRGPGAQNFVEALKRPSTSGKIWGFVLWGPLLCGGPRTIASKLPPLKLGSVFAQFFSPLFMISISSRFLPQFFVTSPWFDSFVGPKSIYCTVFTAPFFPS